MRKRNEARINKEDLVSENNRKIKRPEKEKNKKERTW